MGACDVEIDGCDKLVKHVAQLTIDCQRCIMGYPMHEVDVQARVVSVVTAVVTIKCPGSIFVLQASTVIKSVFDRAQFVLFYIVLPALSFYIYWSF